MDPASATAVAGISASKFFFLTALALAAACVAGYAAWTLLIRKRVMQDMPTALIRSAAQGYVELQGHAELMDGEPIHGRLTMRSCVWYRYKVERKEQQRHGGTQNVRWRTTDSGTSDDLFYLVDATGRCAVDPEGAKVTTHHKSVWYGNHHIPPPERPSTGMVKFIGLDKIGKQYRYTEERIERGDPLYALGNFNTHGGSGTAFDLAGETGDLLREWKKDNAAMLDRFDDNNDGEIDMQEWEKARRAAENEIVAAREDSATAPPVDVLSLGRGRRNPFVITTRSEEDMLKQYHYAATGLFLLSAALFSGCGWAIIMRMSA